LILKNTHIYKVYYKKYEGSDYLKDLNLYSHWRSCISLEYEESGCECDDDICRNIESYKITNINPKNILEVIYESFVNPSEILKYAIERIFSMYNMSSKNNYEVRICNGYYGQEISGIFIDNLNFIKTIDSMLYISDSEIIKKILTEEYRSATCDLIKDFSNAEIEYIEISKIIIGNKRYYDEIKVDFDDTYSYTDIVCIINKNNRIIDGYHRLKRATLMNGTDIDVKIIKLI